MGKGGGGGAPTQTTNYNTNVPEYARPYVERMLGRSEALSQQPYQPYQGQRIADFNPTQRETFQQYENRQPSQQIGMGSNIAAGAGIGSMAAGQNYFGMATNPYATQAFMNPYVSNALSPALDEARRQSDITGQRNASQAVQQGAFGGSRFGIMEAERQRGLAQEQNKMLAQGYATAFDNAQKAQQFGSDLQLRGFGQAMQGANTLGQLGQQAFGQESEILRGRQAVGAAQQARTQEQLTQQYQDFLSQRGYPQQQLAFMSDMLRGVPLSQQTQQQFTAPPSMASQIAQLGLGAYGIHQLTKKEGGVVKSYAEGGIASVDVNKLRGMLSEMSSEQLSQVKQSATDAVTLSLVESQEMMNRRMRDAQILQQELPTQTVKDELLTQGAGIEGESHNEFGGTTVGEVEEPPVEAADGGIMGMRNGGYTPPKGMDPFIKSIMNVESRGNPNAVSPKGATGLMQLMPHTAKNPGWGVKPAKDASPEENVRVGTEYFNALKRHYGDANIALAAYNWGPGNVNKHLKKYGELTPSKLPKETRKYIQKVNAGVDTPKAPKKTELAGLPAAQYEMPFEMFSDEPRPFDPSIDIAGMQEGEVPMMARGGIVAFAGGSKKPVESKPSAPTYEQQLASMDLSSPAMSEAEIETTRQKAMEEREKYLGEDPNDKLMADYTKMLGSGVPKNERNAVMAFKAMKYFAEPGPFMSQLGKAGAGLGEDIAASKKEERETKRLLSQAQMDYNKAKRAEKAGKFDLASKYALDAASRREAALTRETDRLGRLAGFDMQREGFEKQLQASRISAGPAWAAANKKDINTQMYEDAVNGAISDAIAKNGGKPLSKAQMDKVRSDAAIKFAPMIHPGYGNSILGADKLAVQQANEANDRIKQIEAALKAHKLGVTPLTPQQVVSLEREMEEQRGVVARGTGASSAAPTRQAQLTPRDREALEWANANPRDPRAAQIKQRLGVQ